MERLDGGRGGPDVTAAHASLVETLGRVRAGWETLGRIAVASLGPSAFVQALVVGRMQAATASELARAEALGDASLAEVALTRAPFVVLTALAAVLGMLVAQGAMTHATSEALEGRAPCVVASLRVGLRCLPPLLLQHLVVSVLVVGGLLLLVVPGLVALLAYFLVYGLAGPAVVVEGLSGIDALDRSADLTRGHKGTIALSFLPVAGILIGLAGLSVGLGSLVTHLVTPLAGRGSTLGAFAATLAGTVPEAVYVALATTYWTVIYARTRSPDAPKAVTSVSRALA